MSKAFDKISEVWKKFPIEFKNSTLYDNVNKLKMTFENKKHFFDNFLAKIVIIGNVSTGKSTLINALLGKDYFESTTGNGTVAFFYCSLSEKNYEYFTVNNCQIEYKEIETLKNTSRLNINLPDYFDEKSVIKVYVKHDRNEILERKTVIVDCPGLGHSEEYNEAVKNHCSNADMFIFMFQFNKPITLNQMNFIKKLRENDKRLTCFFVYNKCDLPDFNDNVKISLRRNFDELFGEQYLMNLMLDFDPLYFMSARFPNKYEDFARLKYDIMIHKEVKFHLHANVQSKLSLELDKFCEILSHFGSKETEKISSLKIINEKKNQILEFVKRRTDNCKNNLLLDKIFDIMLTEIYDCDDECNKKTAPILICKIEENIKRKINEFVDNHLKNSCIDSINKKLQEIRDDTHGNVIINDVDLRISSDHLIIPIYRNIEDIFFLLEFGDKTKKVKNYYAGFIQSEAIKTQINDSIKNLYNNEFSKIQMHIEDFLDNSSSENIKNSEGKLKILFDYEKEFDKHKELYNSSIL